MASGRESSGDKGSGAHPHPRPPIAEASFLWRRFAAYLLDLSLLMPIVALAVARMWMLLNVAGVQAQRIRGDMMRILLVTWLAMLAVVTYNRWWRQGTTGQSWGKRVMGLRLAKAMGGGPIGPWAAFVRDLFNGFIAIGPAYALIHPQGLTLGDVAVGAVVYEDAGSRRRSRGDRVSPEGGG